MLANMSWTNLNSELWISWMQLIWMQNTKNPKKTRQTKLHAQFNSIMKGEKTKCSFVDKKQCISLEVSIWAEFRDTHYTERNL